MAIPHAKLALSKEPNIANIGQCSLQHEYEVTGRDTIRHIWDSESADACAESCSAESECALFQYYSSQSVCYRFRSGEIKPATSGYTVGRCLATLDLDFRRGSGFSLIRTHSILIYSVFSLLGSFSCNIAQIFTGFWIFHGI
jgi:hypothetical protein